MVHRSSLANEETMTTLIQSTSRGQPLPLGATKLSHGINFALVSETAPTLCLAKRSNPTAYEEIPLTSTGNVWHVHITTAEESLVYGYKINGKILVDPYAKLL